MRPCFRFLPVLFTVATSTRAFADGPASAPVAAGPAPAPAAAVTPAAPPPVEPVTGDGMVVHTFDASGQDTSQSQDVTGAVYLNPGPMLTVVGGRQETTAYGAEVSLMAFTEPTWKSFGAGAFIQGQVYEGKYPRFAVGAQAAAANLGVELGIAYRQGDVVYDSTIGAHGGVFLSLGYLVFALRAVVPVVSIGDTHASYGFETGLTIALKLPIMLAGHDPTGMALFSQ